MDAEHLFRKHFAQYHALRDITTIDLPGDAAILRRLAELCRAASRMAVRDGKHMEVRRLTDLAQQLDQRTRALAVVFAMTHQKFIALNIHNGILWRRTNESVGLMIGLGFFGLLCGICYSLMGDKRRVDKESGVLQTEQKIEGKPRGFSDLSV